MIIDEDDWENEMDRFIQEYTKNKFDEGANADEFFNSFRSKYIVSHQISFWNEISVYKELLKRIQDKYPDEYKEIHKGTPFFWIGWHSFLAEYYDQAIFYIDAAMAEDKKNHPDSVWPTSGAAQFFKLELNDYRKFFGSSNARELKDLLKEELDRFNSLNSGINTTLENFIEDFVENILPEDNTSLITTLYTFIFEKEDILEMIQYRGEYGGTIEPMVLHLFKGSLIFETLLKQTYPAYNEDGLGTILQKLQTDYNFSFDRCTPESFRDIFQYIEDRHAFLQTAFCITYKIRNKGAHNLNWEDLFTSNNYEKIYQQILNAIFIVIQKGYLTGSS